MPSPVFELDSVRVGPSPPDSAYDSHIARTRGSLVTWGDEWRFEIETGQLVSLIWRIPEANVRFTPVLPQPHSATLSLSSMGGEIDVPAAKAFVPDMLICCRDFARPPTLLAFRIAPDLSVLVAEGVWWGWALERPLDHLVRESAPDALGPIVSRWYELVSDETLDALMERNRELGNELKRLYACSLALAHPAAEKVAGHIYRTWKNFFEP